MTEKAKTRREPSTGWLDASSAVLGSFKYTDEQVRPKKKKKEILFWTKFVQNKQEQKCKSVAVS